MTSAAVFFAVRGLRLGPLRLTAYGACAAIGVLIAMALSGRAARHSGVSSESVWDAGLFAVVCCFAASRLLLVLGDPAAFVRYPLVVLGLPSLTFGGMALAATMVWVYVRRKRLPLLQMMDVFAPGAAMLGAFLELGHWSDGSEEGMPVLRNGHAVAYRPVAMFGVGLSLGLFLLLWRASGRLRVRGRVAGMGLVLGGLIAFGLDMIELPSDFLSSSWLEPGQLVALAAMLAGSVLWTFAPNQPRQGRETVPPASAPGMRTEVR